MLSTPIASQRVGWPGAIGAARPTRTGRVASNAPGTLVQGVRAGADVAWTQREQARAALWGSAAVLHDLIEQMGGAATSIPRGSYVNLRT
jgi:hypothetical protein